MNNTVDGVNKNTKNMLENLKQRLNSMLGEMKTFQEELDQVSSEYGIDDESIDDLLEREVPDQDKDNILDLLERQIKEIIEEKERRKGSNSNDLDSDSINDGIVVVSHPVVRNSQFLAVANELNDEVAVSEVVSSMSTWFATLDEEIVKDSNRLQGAIVDQLFSVQERDFFQREDSSFAGVITGDDTSIIVGFGDPKIYTYHSGEIVPFDGIMIGKNDSDKKPVMTEVIGNDEYSTLMLVSSGAHGNILNDRVKIITNKTDRISLAQELLESSMKSQNKKKDAVTR